ncbi:AraC family transcriptional regulator [Bacillus sp. FJAT-50079]|uniref:helix-turn-helix transcriptional regulator n=1 Tax=Bacillus sp. FJAT-50079 TaxID=2833577 RepID=UPI001BC9DD38|nr:AraC family transcriptional regulator [Bacillus sp. FJAT-50079]MBS4210389.1 helix-turn-helix transcriptional regulator [Bacillus sp. FJAT-50079]
MTYTYEELADDFVNVPIQVHGVYRTELKANFLYSGHVDQPTTKCAIIVALRGQADFIFDHVDHYQMKPGKVLIGGLQKQLEIQTGHCGFEYYLVHYLPLSSNMVDVQRLIDVSMLHVALDLELLELQEQLLQAASFPGSMGLMEKKTLFYRTVNKLLQSERHQQNKESYIVIDETIQYIQAHYSKPLSLNLLAERYQMKPKYFSYLFHKYVGVGPIDYLIQYRVHCAQEMLITGQFPVAMVAKSVGYSDAYYFSRLFKKHKGVPPSKVGLYLKRNSPS